MIISCRESSSSELGMAVRRVAMLQIVVLRHASGAGNIQPFSNTICDLVLLGRDSLSGWRMGISCMLPIFGRCVIGFKNAMLRYSVLYSDAVLYLLFDNYKEINHLCEKISPKYFCAYARSMAAVPSASAPSCISNESRSNRLAIPHTHHHHHG